MDRDGKPVERAEVGFLASRQLLYEGRTDAEGRWGEKVPADAHCESSVLSLQSSVAKARALILTTDV